MVSCGHCGTRVLPMANGSCPSCRLDLAAPTTSDDLVQIAHNHAVAQRRAALERAGHHRPREATFWRTASPYVLTLVVLSGIGLALIAAYLLPILSWALGRS